MKNLPEPTIGTKLSPKRTLPLCFVEFDSISGQLSKEHLHCSRLSIQRSRLVLFNEDPWQRAKVMSKEFDRGLSACLQHNNDCAVKTKSLSKFKMFAYLEYKVSNNSF